jgi:hypothetical protein
MRSFLVAARQLELGWFTVQLWPVGGSSDAVSHEQGEDACLLHLNRRVKGPDASVCDGISRLVILSWLQVDVKGHTLQQPSQTPVQHVAHTVAATASAAHLEGAGDVVLTSSLQPATTIAAAAQ